MIEITYRTDQGILKISPVDSLTDDDFENLSSEIERLRQDDRDLNGLLVKTEGFPGYERLSDALAHGEFIEEYHDKIKKVALCTDSPAGPFLEGLGKHLTKAEMKTFDYGDSDEAEKWLLS